MKSNSRRLAARPVSLIMSVTTLLTILGLSGCVRLPTGTNVEIDWINFVQFDGIQYVANTYAVGRMSTGADVGPVFATVRRRLDRNVHDPHYKTKDGDAAYLDAGTPVYSVNGYATFFRLVARFDGRLTFFEADTNPRALTGADLLDIGGKVRFIGLNSQQDGTTELGAIRDPKQVTTFVAMALSARVDQGYSERDSPSYFIAFHLVDGTAVTRAYWLGSGEIARGIMTPAAFGDSVRQAVAG